MKHFCRRFTLMGLVLVLFLLSGQAQAQYPGMDPSMSPMGMVRDMQYGPLTLLSRSEVQKELKLNKSQSEEVKKLQKEQMSLLSEKTKGRDSNDTAQMMEIMKQIQTAQTDLSARAKATLTEEQRQRLGEIRLQAMGLQALQDPELQTALGLTPEQRAAVSTLNSDYMMAKTKVRPSIWSAGGYKKRLESLDKEFQEKAVNTLTPEQNSLLKKMQGEPFKDIKKITG